MFNLSKLAVWWLRLGIDIERIKPGHPQQNGRHERMHLTLKIETTRPAAQNCLAKFDDFIGCYNTERPHQALAMRCPAELYTPSPRPYAGLPDLHYPFHDKAVTVTTCGRICFNRQKINLSQVFAGQTVGIKQVDEHLWLATFMHYDLGYFDDETCRLEPIINPFGPKVLPMSPEWTIGRLGMGRFSIPTRSPQALWREIENEAGPLDQIDTDGMKRALELALV